MGSNPDSVSAAEQRPLSLLIGPTTPPEMRHRILERLQARRFGNVDNQELFNCFASRSAHRAGALLVLLTPHLG
jgi:hypothetical protein